MRTHAHSQRVVVSACKALRLLAADTACRAEIVAAGGADAIRHTRTVHAADENVAAAAGAALPAIEPAS